MIIYAVNAEILRLLTEFKVNSLDELIKKGIKGEISYETTIKIMELISWVVDTLKLVDKIKSEYLSDAIKLFSIEELEAIIRDREKKHSDTSEREPVIPHPLSESCPLIDCPHKNISTYLPSQFNLERIQNLSFASGAPGHKKPNIEFMALIRLVHRDIKHIKEVILTDRYIYSDVGEDGARGGFANLINYLYAVGVDNNLHFTLKLNPHASTTERKKDFFRAKIKQTFPNIIVATYSAKYFFHDRFYLVRDKYGKLTGIYGPSLNGLDSRSIVLMGEIKGKEALGRLDRWLQ